MNNRGMNESANKAAEAASKASSEGARAVESVADQAAKAGERTSRAAGDVFRQGAETTRDALQSGLNTAAQSFQRITDQFTQVLGFNGPHSEELARRSTQNLQAVSQASSVLSRGAQEVSQEWFGLVQARAQKNIDGLSRLASCRSVQDLIATQSDLVRDGLQQVIDTNQRVAELSVRTAQEAARTIQTQTTGNEARVSRAA